MKIKIENLSKSFDADKEVLKAISLTDDIHALSIIGPSGGGKSTLLRILGGLIPPSEGEMWINEQAIPFTEEALRHYRRKIGFVFQQGGLFHHLTAFENITLPLIKVHGFSESDAKNRAEALLTRFNLLSDAQKKPAALSGGQRQRIAIARAVANEPRLLLLDEPTSALDPEFTTEVLDIINELKEDGIDFIIVTHEMGFARHACDKVAFLYDGQLLEYGPSDRLFHTPETKELKNFLGKLLEWNV